MVTGKKGAGTGRKSSDDTPQLPNQEDELYKKKNLWVTPRQNRDLKKLSKLSGLNQSEHMRRALDQYLDEKRRKGELQDEKPV